MSRDEFTPGPWMHSGYGHNVLGPWVAGGQPRSICELKFQDIKPAELMANARLVSSAPEMLAVLRGCREALQGSGLRVLDAVDYVIERATGEDQVE